MRYTEIKPLIKLKKELNILDYIIPKKLNVKTGQLVEILFRNQNKYGIVFNVKEKTNQPINILKSVNKIVYKKPIINKKQIEFYKWFVDYNFSSLNFLNNIIPVPLKRKVVEKENKITIHKTDYKVKNIQPSILKNKTFIFKHKYFSEKLSLIKKTIDENIKKSKETLIICPTKQHLQKMYSCLMNFYKQSDITIITGYTHLNKTEHNKIWNKIQSNDVKIILGTKVYIFYPINNVKTIIVDESENENHNQIDVNPRFEFLPNIIKLAEINNAQLILTSYSPLLESYYLASQKKIKLLESKPQGKTEIKILEMNIKYFENQIHFNTEQYINESLLKNKKVLFLINKKGYSKSLYCPDCGFIFKCHECDSILTYQIQPRGSATPGVSNPGGLYCYNCKKQIPMPIKCPKCNNVKLKTKGIGSRQLYSKIQNTFPNYKTLLIDKDHEQNLKFIKNNDIIVATRIIIDHINENEFDLITLPLAHQFLNSNFDSNEKFYQFISKLISLKPNKLILQVLNELKIYDYIKNQNYYKMAKDELEFRKLFKYPPFYDMLKITIKDKNQKILNQKINKLYNEVKSALPNNAELMPIIEPKIKKTFAFYLKYIMIKYQCNTNINKLKKILNKIDIIEKDYFKL